MSDFQVKNVIDIRPYLATSQGENDNGVPSDCSYESGTESVTPQVYNPMSQPKSRNDSFHRAALRQK